MIELIKKISKVLECKHVYVMSGRGCRTKDTPYACIHCGKLEPIITPPRDIPMPKVSPPMSKEKARVRDCLFENIAVPKEWIEEYNDSVKEQ